MISMATTKQETIGKIAIVCCLNGMELKVKPDQSIKVSMEFNVGLTGKKCVSYHDSHITGYTLECVEELATLYTSKETSEYIEFVISQFDPF